jgi:hypothetical protein
MVSGLHGVCGDPEEIARGPKHRAGLDPELGAFVQSVAADAVQKYFSRPSP